MEGALLLAFWGGLFGAMLLILFFGYRSIEEERARSEKARAAERVLDRPRFFANLAEADGALTDTAGPAQAPGYSAYVDTVVHALEHHIRRESAATSAFVDEPSIERLYGYSSPPISIALRRHADEDSPRISPPERAE